MPSYTPKTTLPGDFTWKPKMIVSKELKPVFLKASNGMGVTKTLKIGTLPTVKFTLEFESSYKTYQEIDAFLAKTGYGFDSFTWYCPLDGILYTVRLAEGVSPEFMTDNTSAQNVLSVNFSLVFEVQR